MTLNLPLETQTLYAELLERLRLGESERNLGHLSGGFAQKTVGVRSFWYFRSSEGASGRAEFYVGPDDEATRRLIDRYKTQRQVALTAEADLGRLASMLRSGGCDVLDTVSARVVHALAAGGMFQLGGVMVGTHAYRVLGNLLGVRWAESSRTQDIDVAAFRTMEIAALPSSKGQANVWGSLDALEMGFLPTPGLDPHSPHTFYRVRKGSLRVDFLTTASRRGEQRPIFLPRFQAVALPMRYMDYLLEGNLQAAALHGGVTMVRVPDAARFGLHKLLVAEERPVTEQTKAVKDIAQAREMLGFLISNRPGDVALACDALRQKGLHKKVMRTLPRQLEVGSEVRGFLVKELS